MLPAPGFPVPWIGGLTLILCTTFHLGSGHPAGAFPAPQEDSLATQEDTVLRPDPDTIPEDIPGYSTVDAYLQSLHLVELPEDGDGPGLELDLVINETRTPTGQDFFDEFYAAWEAPDEVPTYTIRIQEEPVQGLYTRVVLTLDGEQLFQLPLQPRHEYIRSVARQAASYVRDQLLQARSGAASGDAVRGGGR